MKVWRRAVKGEEERGEQATVHANSYSGSEDSYLHLLEPAVLLLTAASGDSSNYYTLACVAYGAPLPHIEWLASSTAIPVNGDAGFFINSTEVVTTINEGGL